MGGGGLGWGGGLSRGVIELTSLQSAEISDNNKLTLGTKSPRKYPQSYSINEENYVKVNTILNRIVHV